MITFAKRGDLHARRRVLTVVRDKGVVHTPLHRDRARHGRARPAATPASRRSAPARATTRRWPSIELVREAYSPKKATVKELVRGGNQAGGQAAVELPAGAVAANADGSAPEGYTVKGNADSGLYHVPGSQWYDATEAEFWFKSAADAEAAGFKPAGGAAKQKVDDEA
jgi:large subunit ribosomal protein L17